MRMKIAAVLATIAPLALAGTVHAQTQGDAAAGGAAPMMELPAACMSDAGTAMGSTADMGMGNMEGMGGHRAMMMEGMRATHGPMMMGMMNEDHYSRIPHSASAQAKAAQQRFWLPPKRLHRLLR